MSNLKQHVIAALIGSIIGAYLGFARTAEAQIAPQTPQQAQSLEKLGCRKAAYFIAQIADQRKAVPIAVALDKVNPPYFQVVMNVYADNIGPYEAYWYTYGYCLSGSNVGKEKA